jgi:hypothetical protein
MLASFGDNSMTGGAWSLACPAREPAFGFAAILIRRRMSRRRRRNAILPNPGQVAQAGHRIDQSWPLHLRRRRIHEVTTRFIAPVSGMMQNRSLGAYNVGASIITHARRDDRAGPPL